MGSGVLVGVDDAGVANDAAGIFDAASFDGAVVIGIEGLRVSVGGVGCGAQNLDVSGSVCVAGGDDGVVSCNDNVCDNGPDGTAAADDGVSGNRSGADNVGGGVDKAVDGGVGIGVSSVQETVGLP